MRLLAVSPLPGLAGGEMLLLRSLPELARRGWDVRLAVPQRGPLSEAAAERGLATTVLPLGPPERRTLASFAGALKAPLVARGARVLLLNGLSTQRVLRAPGVRAPAVLHVNNPLEETPAAWRRKGFWDRVRAVLADTRYTADQCVAAGAPGDRVHVLPPPAWGVGERPEDHPREPGESVVFLGQIEPRKGVTELLDAAGEFLRERPQARLTVIGAAPSGHEDYEHRVRELAAGLGERVTLTGHRPGGPAALAEHDLAVVPSLAEPYGTVALEAQAAGLPVVASAVGGLPEVVADGRTGMLVAPGDPAALARAVIALLADPERRARMGAEASRHADAYSPEAYAERLDEILRAAAS